MAKGKIWINSNDVDAVIRKISDSVIELQNNAYTHVDKDYKDLEEAGLITTGTDTTKKGIDALINKEVDLIKLLQDHLDTCKKTEDEIVSYINSFDYSKGVVKRSTASSSYDKSTVDEVRTERKISNTNLIDFISGLDYPLEKILLVNINKNASLFTTDINNLLLNPEKSGLLVEVLKKICGDTNTDIDTKTTLESKNIQKCLLEKLTDNDDNIYSTVIGKSLLSALPYVSKKSENENIKFDDLIYGEDNKNMLLDTLNDLYKGKPLEGYDLKSEEINCFREYINGISEKSNISVESLFSDVNNLNLIKKGA